MPDPPLSDPVLALLREDIDSFEKMEVLLWLRLRAEPTDMRTLEQGVSLPAATLREVLCDLAEAELIRVDSTAELYLYAPKRAELARTVDELALGFDADPIPIIKRMSDNAIDRVRGSAAKAFAKAFIWNRKKPDG